MPKKQRQSLTGIRRVEILNTRETVTFKNTRAKATSFDGVFSAVDAAGHSRLYDTLYLVAFTGTVTLPSTVEVSYRHGISHLQRALLDTYAPSLPYTNFLKARAEALALTAYQQVPVDKVIEISHRFADFMCAAFSTPQSMLFTPPVLKAMERVARSNAFKFDGAYRVLPNLLAGQLVIAPEIGNARTVDEAVLFTAAFVKNKMAITGPPRQLLIKEIDKISIEMNTDKLRNHLGGLQKQMATGEAWVRASSTTVRKENDARMAAGIKELDRLGIGYGAALVKHFSTIRFPISTTAWDGIMGQVAAQEVKARSKTGKQGAPASAATTAAVVVANDADALETALKAKQEAVICLHEDIATNIRIKNQANATVARDEAIRRGRKWATEQDTWEYMAGRHAKDRFDRGEKHYHSQFTTDADGNRVRIRTHTKAENDREMRERIDGKPTDIAPSPSSSPSPEPTPPDDSGGGVLNRMGTWFSNLFN